MASTDSAVAVDQSPLVFANQATLNADAQATASTQVTSVEGIAEASGVVSKAVGVLDSTINAGADATLNVNETGVADAKATTVNAVNLAATAAGDPNFGGVYTTTSTNQLANGDQIHIGGATYYVVNRNGSASGSTYQLSSTLGGSALTTDLHTGLYAVLPGAHAAGAPTFNAGTYTTTAAPTGLAENDIISIGGTNYTVFNLQPGVGANKTYQLKAGGNVVATDFHVQLADLAGDPTFAALADGTYRTTTANTLAEGDRIVIASGDNAGSYYVTNLSGSAVGSTYQLAEAPGGAALITDLSGDLDLTATQTEVVAATSYAGFTGSTGGIIDSGTAQADDIQVGNNATIDVTVGNKSNASSANAAGDAYATSNLAESYGLNHIDLVAGNSGTLLVNLDADASSTATTVGSNVASTYGGGADANAETDATNIVGINDIGAASGDFSLGNDATISVRAGTSANKITVGADASTKTGNATADADSTAVAGIIDTQDGAIDTTTNILEVGNNGTITATAFTDFHAKADTTNGDATADSTVGNVLGIQADQIKIGDQGSIQSQAGSQIAVSATTVNGIVADEGDANATATLDETKGLDLESLVVGNNAIKDGSYGVLGRSDVNMAVNAASSGADSNTDVAQADGQIGDAAGIQLGDFNATSGTLPALKVGNAATIAGITNLALNSTAGSVDGATDAVAFVGNDDNKENQTGAIGIDVSDDVIIGATATVLADSSVTLAAVASNVGNAGEGASSTAAAGADFIAGLDARNDNLTSTNNPEIHLGSKGTITANGTAAFTATASSEEGAATAEAGSVSSAAAGLSAGDRLDVVGFANDGLVQAGDSLILNAGAKASLDATAKSTTLAATSSAGAETNTGLITNGFISGTTATVNATADQQSKADATSTDASATATATTGSNIGADSTGNFTVGSNGNLTGKANLGLDATALTVGDSSSADKVAAIAGEISLHGILTTNTGLDLDRGSTSFGANGQLTAEANLTANADATGTKADATADVGYTDNTAVDLSNQVVTFGNTGTISAKSLAVTDANATTVDGDSEASVSLAAVSGLGDESGSVVIGAAGSIDASAKSTSTANANSTVADFPGAGAEATVNNDLVQAINLGSSSDKQEGLIVGSTLALAANAASNQSATATNIGLPCEDASGATAEVASGDAVRGINSTYIQVGSNLDQLTASANLQGKAVANNVSGSSTASAGVSSDVAVLNNGSDLNKNTLVVGGNATNGLSFAAVSNLSAQAISVEDQAEAYVGSNSHDTTGFATTDSTVNGIDTASISVGGNAGTITASAASTLSATAQTNGHDDSVDKSAVAQVAQLANGLTDSQVVVGGDGNLTTSATLSGTVIAENIGTNGSHDENSTARLTFDADAIQLNNDAGVDTYDIQIGGTGNVVGRTFTDGSATSNAISGNADTYGNIKADGIELNDESTKISIGKSGSITGLAVIGNLTDGAYSNQISLIASTVAEEATARGVFDGTGIHGTDGGATQTLLSAGPSGGNITGQVLGGAKVIANTTGSDTSLNDTATATIDPSSLYGIQDANIFGGLVGTNLVKGTAYGDFDAIATSIHGDVVGRSDVKAYGIFDSNNDGTITTSGNIQAIATLLNTVTSSSVQGNATASSSSDAVGLSGYNVHIIGGGTLTANATSNSTSSATSVNGRAGA